MREELNPEAIYRKLSFPLRLFPLRAGEEAGEAGIPTGEAVSSHTCSPGAFVGCSAVTHARLGPERRSAAALSPVMLPCSCSPEDAVPVRGAQGPDACTGQSIAAKQLSAGALTGTSDGADTEETLRAGSLLPF